MAGVTHADISTLMIYDNFTPTVLFSLEATAIARRRAGRSSATATLLGARYPTKPFSESYIQGWALNLEAVLQARRVRRAASEGLRVRALHGGAPVDLDVRRGAVMKPLPQIDGADARSAGAAPREVKVQRCGIRRIASRRSLLRAMSPDDGAWVAVATRHAQAGACSTYFDDLPVSYTVIQVRLDRRARAPRVRHPIDLPIALPPRRQSISRRSPAGRCFPLRSIASGNTKRKLWRRA
jgi:hypothetical protein